MKFFTITFKLVALAVAATTLGSPVRASEKPNVILILADDLGAGMLSCNGQKIITTPHIDQLAREGMSFSNHYGNTYCAPARWSLLTGMHNGRSGSGSHTKGKVIPKFEQGKPTRKDWDAFFHKLEKKAKPVPKDEVFLAQVAQRAGYHTAQFGKLDVGFLTWHNLVARHGWDEYLGYYDHSRAHAFFPAFLWHNGKRFPLPGNEKPMGGRGSEAGIEPVGFGGETYSQDVFLKGILQYLRDHKDEPFFLYHPTQLPHGPVAVKKLHPEVVNRKDLTLSEKKYATMVKSLDASVGRIMEELKTLGIDKKTIVIFASDNGHETYYQNAQGNLPKRMNRSRRHADGSKANITDSKWRASKDGDVFHGAGDRAGLKWEVFQGGVNTPLIVRWPDKVKPGSKSDLLCTLYDFLPSLADLTGGKHPQGKDGISYVPTLLGKNPSEQKTHDWIFLAGGRSGVINALITKDGWKLIGLPQEKSYQLYNILKDPGEYRNLEHQFPERVKSLMPIFQKQINSSRPDLAS